MEIQHVCQRCYSRVVGIFSGYWEQSLSIGSVVAFDSGEVHGAGYVSLCGMTGLHQQGKTFEQQTTTYLCTNRGAISSSRSTRTYQPKSVKEPQESEHEDWKQTAANGIYTSTISFPSNGRR